MITLAVALSVVAAVAYVAMRRPAHLAYAYLFASPFDAYQLAFGSIFLSVADVLVLGLVAACFVLRARTVFLPPNWYQMALGLIVAAILISLLANRDVASVGAARAMIAKILGAYCVACIMIDQGSLKRAIHALALGVAASVSLGVVQQGVYIWSGWDALLATVPRVVNPGGVGGSWADTIANRGEIGFAVVSPTRGFTPFAMRMPGGTPHAALLGLLVAFPLGLGIGGLFARSRPRWHALALTAAGVLGFCVTEGRAVILAAAVAVSWLLLRTLMLRRSPLIAAALMGALAVQVGIFVAFMEQDMGLRRDALADAVSDLNRFVFGMGPGEYEHASAVGINVHSTPLQIFTDVGIVGMAAYAFLVSGMALSVWRNSRSGDILVLGAAVFGYLVPATFFHPSAGTREHWIIVSLAAVASTILAAERRDPARAVAQPAPAARADVSFGPVPGQAFRA